jgi:serine/threonine protein kinase
MGAVYEAVDQRLGITVALKETLSSETAMRRQFEREARLLAGMQHPALPRVSDHFVQGDRAFLVMQFIAGVDLAKIIAQQPGPFPRDQVIAWADQLLDALIYLHSRDRQVIHRDIKPHNLKLTGTGQIALLDFGLAKSQPSDPSITSSQAFFGYSRHYAPLEQIQDQRTDPRSDIYALGATLYHLLTGVKPPDAMVRASAVLKSGPDPLLPANKINEAVGEEISAILSKAMAQNPQERYHDAADFREALRRVGRSKETTSDLNEDSSGYVGSGHLMGPMAPTIHIDELTSSRLCASQCSSAPVVKMALVGSARRFGPAGVTACLAILLIIGAGILYGSQGWLPALNDRTLAERGTSAVTQRQQAMRKADRSRIADAGQPAISNSKSSAKPNADERTLIGPEAPSNSNANKQEEVQTSAGSGMNPQKSVTPDGGGARRDDALRLRRDSRRVIAPSIRFPSFELRDNPSPSPDARIRSGSSSSMPATAPPKFYRAADGTQIIKFSDGSTRIIRPGQRTDQSDGYDR